MSTVDDWLALHRLANQDLTDWLKACERPQTLSGLRGLRMASASMVIMFKPLPMSCRNKNCLALSKALSCQLFTSCWACPGPSFVTRSREAGGPYTPTPKAGRMRVGMIARRRSTCGCIMSTAVSSPLSVAHEFVHVLQPCKLKRVPAPQCCEKRVPSGELALMGFEDPVCRIDASSIPAYLAPGKSILLWRRWAAACGGPGQPNQAYRYAINYPLARAAALALGNGASRPLVDRCHALIRD